jgi:N utilization substance protein A
MRGSRVQAVVSELQGEKIDIIPWSPDPATFVVNALAPAEVAKVVLDEDAHKIEVVVPDEQLSLAIGRRGQNVRLASMLSGWEIDILTEDEESERRQRERKERCERFVEALDVDDMLANLLVTEGFTSVEEVAYVPIEDLGAIEGFEEEVAAELQTRARAFLEAENERLAQRQKELGMEEKVAEVPGLTPVMLVTLGEHGIKTLEDFADLAGDELTDSEEGLLKDYDLELETANEMIMASRVLAGWFTEEELAAAQAEKEAEGEDGENGEEDTAEGEKGAADGEAEAAPPAEKE